MQINRRHLLIAIAAAAVATTPRAQRAFDHGHAAWEALLARHVRLAADGNSSRVDYAGFMTDRSALSAYLQTLSSVTADEYARWSKPQQYAFLANAYNAFTVEKVLTRWPDLKSIRDFGGVFSNPWKDRFFTLLGKRQHLDGIEHETMRALGVFDDPRVHVAVNCASIGCPMLGRQALVAEKLDTQLEDLMRRFLSDRTRNRYNGQTKTLELSRIFDWYKNDFEKGGKSFLGYAGFTAVEDVAARYAELFAQTEADRGALRNKTTAVKFLEYDWTLNAVSR